MEINKTVDIAFPRAAVWAALSDVRLVAQCLPGASLTEELGDDRYKGQFKVKVGPLTGAFDGEVSIVRHPADYSAEVSGKGGDAKTSSRVSGSMAYRVEEAGPSLSRLQMKTEVALAGAFAQFGKAAVIQEIANRITAEFVRNLEQHLTANAPASVEPVSGEAQALAPVRTNTTPPPAARELDAGNLFWAILRDRVVGFFRRLAGRASP